MPWARAAASIRCSTNEAAIAQDCLATSERVDRHALGPPACSPGTLVNGPMQAKGTTGQPHIVTRRDAHARHALWFCPAALTATGQIDGYLASLEHLQSYGCLPKPPTSKTASGQTVVDVFPTVSCSCVFCGAAPT